MAKKKQYCFNCGEYLGEYHSWPEDIETCGSAECEKEARRANDERQADVEEKARRDNYDRYK